MTKKLKTLATAEDALTAALGAHALFGPGEKLTHASIGRYSDRLPSQDEGGIARTWYFQLNAQTTRIISAPIPVDSAFKDIEAVRAEERLLIIAAYNEARDAHADDEGPSSARASHEVGRA